MGFERRSLYSHIFLTTTGFMDNSFSNPAAGFDLHSFRISGEGILPPPTILFYPDYAVLGTWIFCTSLITEPNAPDVPLLRNPGALGSGIKFVAAGRLLFLCLFIQFQEGEAR